VTCDCCAEKKSGCVYYDMDPDGATLCPECVEPLVEGNPNDVKDTVALCVVILGGLTDVWAPLDYAERCARAENELRHLLDRIDPDGAA
jgi:hypothetical protein